MLDKKIYIYPEEETVKLNGKVPFACTNAFFTNCSKLGIDANQFLKQFALNNAFLIIKSLSKNMEEKPIYQILAERALLKCSISDEGYFVIIGILEKRVKFQNEFIRSSVKLIATDGAIIWYNDKTTGRMLIYSTEESITPYTAKSKSTSTFNQVSSVLIRKLETTGSYSCEEILDEQEQQEENRTLSEDLDELLNISEYYTIAEDEIQKIEAQSGSQVSYYKFESASDYTRVEKVAYIFFITNVDKRIYKKNTRVYLELSNQETSSGVIVDIDIEQEPKQLTIMFDNVFNVEQLPQKGIIALEYNSVQRQVREAVINDLRSFNSKASYFYDVVGLNRFSEFEEKELSNLVNSLKSSKTPPNDSQIVAIVKGINIKDALLVLGPPGTGKTTVILEWVKHFIKQEEKKVLISSQNNKAVDNVLERLAKESDIEIIRIGSEDKVQTNVQHLMFESRAYELQKRIAHCTDNNIKLLQVSETNINIYLQNILKAKIALEKFLTEDKLLKNEYAIIEATYSNVLRSIYSEFKENSYKLDSLEKEIHSTALFIWNYNNSNSILRLIKYLTNRSKMSKLSKLYEQFQLLIQTETYIAQKYNSTYATMVLQLSSDKMKNIKHSWRRLREEWQEERKEVLTPPNVHSALLKITLPESKDSLEVAELSDIIEECKNKLETIKLIRGAILRWIGYLEQKRNYALAQVLLESVDLVGATCIGINSQQRFKDLRFDVTIIDEAGQIQIHNAIVPMSRSSKIIMLGDHLQIPPIKDENVSKRCEDGGIDTSFLSTSLFEYLYKRFPDSNKLTLDTQYRMPSEIADLLSEWFYDKKYKSFQGKRNMKSSIPQLFNSPFVVISTSNILKRFETKEEEEYGYYNKYESTLVAKILKVVFNTVNPETTDPSNRKKYVSGGRNFNPVEVGVITPYSLQVKAIRTIVNQELPHLSRTEINDLIASLDSFQGQERPIIIFSCTRSSRLSPQRERIGFLKELRRLNVALSRPQMQLVFIGDIDFLSICEYEKKDEFGNLLKDENNRPIPGTSEKEFADFIKFMIEHINKGNGQFIESSEIERKLNSLTLHCNNRGEV